MAIRTGCDLRGSAFAEPFLDGIHTGVAACRRFG
jgi:hypothetical protein